MTPLDTTEDEVSGDNLEIQAWQFEHISQGLEDAEKGDFASDEDIEELLLSHR